MDIFLRVDLIVLQAASDVSRVFVSLALHASSPVAREEAWPAPEIPASRQLFLALVLD